MTTTAQHEERESKGLRAGAIGLFGSIVVGIASTAPAYSLAASLGYVVIVENGDGIVGVKAPLIMVLAFIPMYCIAVAYSELNKAEPDCGTTFTWAARAFGTAHGLARRVGDHRRRRDRDGQPVADRRVVLVPPGRAPTAWPRARSGARSPGSSGSSVMTYICYRGIEVSVRLQYALLGIEVATLVAFAFFALVKVYAGDAPGSIKPSLDWLSPSGLSTTAHRERHPDRGVHLLGLGHRRRDERGVRRSLPPRRAGQP